MNYPNPLVDSFGRRINYLRISLTDRCNFRCIYCMPAKGLSVVPKSDHLMKHEIIRFVNIIAKMGMDRIRLTGGEPLLRKDILEIIRSIKEIGIEDLSITTNGSFLAPLVKPLKECGLDRINISLDSMNSECFKAITLTDHFRRVVQSIGLALKEGIPVKVNVVVLKNLNHQEIIDFVNLAFEYPLEVRFLEFMPLCGSGWRPDLFMSIADVRKLIRDNFDLMKEIPESGNVAQTFGIQGGRGKVGFIGSLTESFCEDCSRIRLTCDGKIRPCLFSNQEVSIRDLLRRTAPDEEIVEAIRYAVKIKPRGNYFHEKSYRASEEPSLTLASMPYIRSIGG